MAGGKPKFAQITGEVNRNFHKLQGVEFFIKVQNQINFKLQGRNPKKNILHGRKPKMTYITGGKTLLTLTGIHCCFAEALRYSF